jgi:hypothetical protein
MFAEPADAFGILPTAPSSFAMIYGKLNGFFAEVL